MDNLAQIYERDKATLNEYLDNNHNLPAAVIDALLIRIVSLADFVKLLDDTGTPKCAEATSEQN